VDLVALAPLRLVGDWRWARRAHARAASLPPSTSPLEMAVKQRVQYDSPEELVSDDSFLSNVLLVRPLFPRRVSPRSEGRRPPDLPAVVVVARRTRSPFRVIRSSASTSPRPGRPFPTMSGPRFRTS